MKKAMSARLSLMMFLQFVVWGAWYTTIGNFMTTIGWGQYVYLPYLVFPIAAIISPFFVGMVADRFFASEKILGVLHLLGGAAMASAPLVAGGGDSSVVPFVGLVFLHSLCYMPSLSLANTLSFHHIEDQEKQFPLIRVFGTVGWIAVGLFVSFVLQADREPTPLYVTGIAGLIMGLYSFTLPHTPPSGKTEKQTVRDILGIDALKQLWNPSFGVFLLSSLLICIPLSAYYSYAPVFIEVAGVANPAGWLTIGQMSEFFFMLLMPVFFARLGVKWMLVVGMAAWFLRYALFAGSAESGIFWMILLGIALHGICFDFFFVTGQIYVDKKATAAIRGQAQGLIFMVTYGFGMLIGAQVAGWLYNGFLSEGANSLTRQQFEDFWWVPAIFSILIAIFFAITFRDKVDQKDTKGEVSRDVVVEGGA